MKPFTWKLPKKVQGLPKDKIRIIDNGIEIDPDLSIDQCRLESKKAELEEFCKPGKIIASIGRLSPEKGFDYLVEAVRILRDEKGEDVSLLLIGDGLPAGGSGCHCAGSFHRHHR